MAATKLTAALAAALSLLALRAAAEETVHARTSFFESAKITVNERARADGFLRVRIRPENGAALEATIDIEKRMRENEIAKQLANALEPALGADYKVDRDAGEHVKIKKARRDAANFAVEITFSSPGFAIILEE